MATGLNYLLPGVFLTECNFASYTAFKNKFKEAFSKLPFNREAVIKELEKTITQYSRPGKINQKKAEQLLLAEDLKKIRDTLLGADILDPGILLKKHQTRILNPESLLKEHYAKIKNLIQKYEIINKFPDYFIVDEFPDPFKNMSWLCMFLDEEEKEIYNIEPGIYFKREFLESYSSSKNLLHELVHIAINQNSSKKERKEIARGLEEGICDIFGSLFLFSELTDIKLARNIMEYTKFSYKEPDMTALYRDNIRMAFLLYKKFGVNGLVDIIKSGRDSLKQIEQSCLKGNYDLNLKKGSWNKDYDVLADYFLGFQRNLVVSPLAYYSATLLKEKDSIEDLIKNNNLDSSAIKALNELQERAFLITINKNRIECDASKSYLKGSLRYENS